MTTIPNNFYRTSIKALILDEDKKFLMCLEDCGMWELPGGGLNFGETPYECIRRELMEEMGVEVAGVDSNPSHFATAKNTKGIWKSIVVYLTTVKDLHFTPSNECVEIGFFTAEEIFSLPAKPLNFEFAKVYDSNNH